MQQFIPNAWANHLSNKPLDIKIDVKKSNVLRYIKPETLIKAIPLVTIFTGNNITFNQKENVIEIKNTWLEKDFIISEFTKLELWLSDIKTGYVDKYVSELFEILNEPGY